MLLATVLALGSAVVHAGWNLVAKRAAGDRFAVLWAQFFVAGIVCAAPLAVWALTAGLPAGAYGWALASGLAHVPYLALLAHAYDTGDFSVTYPIARGGGAAVAAAAGVLFLGDHLGLGQVAGVALVVLGLWALAWGGRRSHVASALLVAASIGAYTTFDARGSRTSGTDAYVLATFTAIAATVTVFGLATGRGPVMAAMLRTQWRRATATGVAAVVTYAMVLVAVRHAAVGYVAALRESSVVLAALAGWRLLGEGSAGRRLLAAGVVLGGLLVLVLAR